MLKIDEASISVKGNRIDLRTELVLLIRDLLNSKVIDEDELDKVVELAKMNEREIREERVKIMSELQEKLAECGTDEDRAAFALLALMLGK